MTSETGSDTSPCDYESTFTGRCKWFNNKAGYGFLTVVRSDDDSKVGTDVFAHHSGIVVSTEQYKYLVQGEYVDFQMTETNGGQHSVQASEITGVGKGPLMCETRNEARKLQEQQRSEDGESSESRPPRRRNNRSGRGTAQVRLKGEGPREGEVWTLTRSSKKGRKRSESTNGDQ